MAFYGQIVKPGKAVPFVPPADAWNLHLSQAALDPDAKKGAKASVLVKYAGEESICICTLTSGTLDSAPIDLFFDKYSEFVVKGDCAVHLSGYFTPADDGDSDDEMGYGGFGGEDEDEDEDDESDEDEDAPWLVAAGRSSVVIEEINDDEQPVAIATAKATEILVANGVARKPSAVNEEDEDEDEHEDEEEDEEEGKAGKVKVAVQGKGSGKQAGKGKVSAGEMDVDEDDEDEEEDEDEDEDEEEQQVVVEEPKGSGKRKATIVTPPPSKAAKAKEAATPKTAAQAPANKQKPATPHPSKAAEAQKKAAEQKKAEQKKAAEEKKAAEQKKAADKKAQTQEICTPPSKKQDTASAKGTPGTPETSANKKSVRKYDNGFEIHELGMGQPHGKLARAGKKVVVNYTGRLQSNGKVFDKSGNKPFTFRLGVGEVIKGWDRGVEGMRVGDKRKLVIPPQMGYGSQGAKPTIPPNATLVFDVELKDVK